MALIGAKRLAHCCRKPNTCCAWFFWRERPSPGLWTIPSPRALDADGGAQCLGPQENPLTELAARGFSNKLVLPSVSVGAVVGLLLANRLDDKRKPHQPRDRYD